MKRETRWVVWSDGAVTMLTRNKEDGDKLDDYVNEKTFSADEARELTEQFRKHLIATV